MSNFWDIPELLFLVLDELEEKDLFQASLVCRLFWEGVMPIVWGTIADRHGIHDILNKFPLHESFDSLRPRDKVCASLCVLFLSLTPAFTLKHWVEASSEARHALYATYIRSFVLKTPNVGHDEFLLLLHSRPLRQIFPDMRDLSVQLHHPPRVSDIFFEDVLKGINLRSFDITFKGPLTTTEPLISALLSRLGIHQPGLQDLIFSFPEPPTPLFSAAQIRETAALIRRLPHLNELQISDLGPGFAPLWTAASQSPHLRHITLGGQIELEADEVLPEDGFESLWTVNVSLLPAHSFAKVIGAIQSSELASLSLFVQSQAEETTLNGALEAVKRYAHLTSLRLELGNIVLAWSDLLPLLLCHELEWVRLVFVKSATIIHDEHVKLLAQSWPALSTFEIEDPTLEKTALTFNPVATLRGLSPLAEHCPELERLIISVSTTDIGEEEMPTQVGLNLRHLDLQWTRASSGHLGAFITKAWPNLETRGASKWSKQNMIEQKRSWDAIWARVDELLGRSVTINQAWTVDIVPRH